MSVPYALFSATVTTNANLTGDVTSTGNAKTIDALKVTNAMLAGSIGTIELLPTGAIIKSGKVIVGTSSAASASAVLEANSTSQGFLPPRMTTTQRNAITAPAAGLQIYNTDNNCLETWNSNGWLSVCGGSILFNGIPIIGSVPNNWVQKTDFGGLPKTNSVGFSIGSKGYIGTSTSSNEFWEYNPANNSWTQKANFGGPLRENAVGFSIGSKGYIGTGNYGGTRYKDFWEYDQVNNVWVQKLDFGGTGRLGAVGFSIGNKGYIGTGLDVTNSFRKDFWEYDALTNTWTQKAIFGGGGRWFATGFSIGNKGYLGIGDGYNDFWEYNPANNTWSQKANFGGPQRYQAVGFSIGSKGYIGTGFNGALLNDFWEYDSGSNSWIQKANFGGAIRAAAIGFSIGNKGYIGTGYNLDINPTKDFWEYAQ